MGLVFLVATILAGCAVTSDPAATKRVQPGKQGTQQAAVVEKEPVPDINDVHIRDNDALYEFEDDTSVVTMYLTVSLGTEAENTDHTWAEINQYSVFDYEAMGVDRYQVSGLLQVGDENGPLEGELGFGETVPNATVQIRGQSSSKNDQKNYKIRLKDDKGSWRGQRTINLNKHRSEGLRFRNKLVYELLQGVPQVMSLRTQFVHLYVKDTTKGAKSAFVDYGLYTQVEQLNRTGLEAHGLDKNGHLYKINNFEFYRYEDTVMLESDPNFNRKAFEDRLECKGDPDHTKLIEMLDVVNDNSVPIDEILDKHFDRENLAYWMAFQMLIGNRDTQNRNFFLYSPKQSDTWYLIPWDNDGAFFDCEDKVRKGEDPTGWELGVSNYWGNVFFQRCLKSQSFREELDAAVQELRAYLSVERLTELVERYSKVVKTYLYRMPDVMHAQMYNAQYDRVCKLLPAEIEGNYQLYLESLEKPMPFYISIPELVNGKLVLSWDAAYDFDAEDITYTVEVSKNHDFRNVLFKTENLLMTEIAMEPLKQGQYFIRVRATNASGYTQDAFDNYSTEEDTYRSMLSFYVQADGSIQEDTHVS